MLDFSRVNFNKQIQLSAKKNKQIASKWELAKIETVCNIGSGGTPSRDIPQYWENGTIPWLKSEVCKGGYVNEANEFITELGFKKSNTKYFEKGTTLIALVGATKGKVGFLNFTATTNQNVAGVYSNDEKKLLNNYLFFVLRNMYDYLVSDLSQYDMLNLTQIKNIKIPLPSIEIQKQLINEYTTIENGVEKAEKEITKALDEIEGYYSELFQKSNSKFKISNDELFEVSIGRRVLAKEVTEDVNSGIPVYSANVLKPFGYINKQLLEGFENGSILWGIDGDWMVNTIEPNNPFYPTDHCGVIRVKSKDLNYKYVAWVLRKEGIEERFTRANRAATERIKGITIQAPPIKDQLKSVHKIEKLEATIKREQEIITASTDKKNEIMKKYL